MRNEAIFEAINMETWPRAQHCYFYSRIAKVGYSITVNVDVTELHEMAKRRGKKFNAAYLHAATKAANGIQAMRTASRLPPTPDSTSSSPGLSIGIWSYLDPVYAVFHDDDKTFSTMYTDYDDYFGTFHENYVRDADQYGHVHGILSKGVPPANALIVSSLPWISFNNYSPVNFSGADSLLPILEAGKFFEKDGRKLMPFSMTAHHAATDGYHVASFIERFQGLCSDAERWV